MSLLIARALIVVSGGLMAAALGLNAKATASVAVLIISGIWLTNTYKQWRAISSLAFLLMVGTAAYGMLSRASSWPWVLISTISMIAAWDLEQLARRLAHFDKIEGPIEAEHIKWLTFVGFLALVAGAAALSFKVSLSFGVAFLIAIVIVFGLSVALRLGVKTTE